MKTQEFRTVESRLDRFLEDLVRPMGRSERRHWAQVYVQGLLLDGQRKSIEPMAERTGADAQSLQQFVNQSPWDVTLVQEQLANKLARDFPPPEAWIIDETSFPKAGSESVGVARQYCGALGKTANCQVAVSLHYANQKVSVPVSWRLYLPKDWCENAQRRQKVKIPEKVCYQGKNDLALELIDQVQRWNLPQAPVVADSAYGNDFWFREALRQLELSYVVAVEPSTKAWTVDPAQEEEVGVTPAPSSEAARKSPGRPRQYTPPEELPQTRTLLQIAQALPARAWRRVTWRAGTKGAMRSRFAMVAVWASHGVSAQRHFERVREWLLIEWPKEEPAPIKYWLGYFGEGAGERPTLQKMVQLGHCRWRVEQDYRELKDELGLDHFEGRHWPGFHHHVTLVSIAFAFLRSEQLRSKKSRYTDSAHGPPTTSGRPHPTERSLPVVPHEIRELVLTT
jgi:SRSO17 transposase